MPRIKDTSKDRRRFSGFALNPDIERDRVVGVWINEQPNAAETVKQLIYMAATGEGLIVSGLSRTAAPEEQEPQFDPTEKRAQTLLSNIDS